MKKPTAVAVLALVMLSATACSEDKTTTTTDVSSSVPSAATTAEATDAPTTETSTAGPSINTDGYMVKKLGEQGGMTNVDGKEIASFTVLKITKDITCTTDFAEKPANGHYVGIYMDVTTTKALTDNDIPYFNTDQWALVGPDGVEENSTSGNAYSCIDEAEKLPTQIDRAMHRKGWVVIDVKNTTGKLRLTQDGLEGGWEYTF